MPNLSGVSDRPRLSTGLADRKSTRLNSSHQIISYAVFCLKKKKQTKTESGKTPSTSRIRGLCKSLVVSNASSLPRYVSSRIVSYLTPRLRLDDRHVS